MGQWIRAPTLNPKTITNQVLGRSLSSRSPIPRTNLGWQRRGLTTGQACQTIPTGLVGLPLGNRCGTKNPRLSRPSKILDSRRRMNSRRDLCRPRMNRRRRPAEAQTGWWIPTPSGAYRRPWRRYALGRTRHQPSRQRRSLMPRPGKIPPRPAAHPMFPPAQPRTTHSRTSCQTRAALPRRMTEMNCCPAIAGTDQVRGQRRLPRARAPRRHHRARCPVAASRALGGHIRQAP